jgi:hypothetical protein
MIVLLSRAAQPATLADPPICQCSSPPLDPQSGTIADLEASVNEEVWEQWCAGIRAHGLARETLGRFAPTLQMLPRALWSRPLEHYLTQSLAELRNQRTHGAKRVHAVLEIIGQLYGLLAQGERRPDLAMRLVPRFVEHIERWSAERLCQERVIGRDELFDSVVSPLVEQARSDGGDQVALVIEARLASPELSSVQTARRLGLHRSHLYDRLAVAATIIHVRWPQGREWSRWFATRLGCSARADVDSNGAGTDEHNAAIVLFDAAVRVFFPTEISGFQSDPQAPVDFDCRSLAASVSPL